MPTAHLLLRLVDRRRAAELDQALAVEAERLRALGCTVRVARGLDQLRDRALAGGEHAELIERLLEQGLLSGRVSVREFDAVVEVAADPLDDAAFIGLAARLGDTLDTQRSTVHAGHDHVLMSGDGAIELFFGLRSVADVTRAQFHEWWLHQLVAHTMHTPGKVGYRQVHADAALGARLATAAGLAFDDLDGVAVEVYPDLTAFFRAIDGGNRPESARTKAETSMIDMTRARAVVTYRG